MKLALLFVTLTPCAALAAVSADGATVDPLTWLTAVVSAMGGFVAWLFKRMLDAQDEDRKQLKAAVEINRAFMEKIEDRDRVIDDLLERIASQQANTDRNQADILRLLGERKS